MGSHSAPSKSRKIAPSLVLAFTAFSVISPLAVLAFPGEAKDEGTDFERVPFLQYPGFDVASVIAQAREQARVPTRVVAEVSSRPANRRETTTRPPTSTPVPTVSTRLDRPTVAQRQFQRASTTPTPVPKKVVLAPPPSTAQIVKRTTKTVPPPTSARPSARIITTTPTKTSTPTTQPQPTSAPTQSSSSSSSSASGSSTTSSGTSAEKVVPIARQYVGTGIPYRMGGNSLTEGMDCSHFVWTVLKKAGYSVPYRSSSALASWTKRVTNPIPGDLVLYQGHVGIYAGNGMMIHHGSNGGAFYEKVFTQNFIGYGRMSL